MDRTYQYTRPKFVPQQSARTKTTRNMLCLLLRRLTFNNLQNGMNKIKDNSQFFVNKLQKVQKLSSLNSQICVAFAWQKLKHKSIMNKKKNRIIKDIFVLSKQIEKNFLLQAFCKLKYSTTQNNYQYYQKLADSKKYAIACCLKNLYLKNKKGAFNMLKYNIMNERHKNRISIISTIFKSAQRRNLILAWLKLHVNKVKSIKTYKNQVQNLQYQIQDMRIQIDNKNSNINRLKQQLEESKHNSITRQGQQSSLIFNNSFGNRSCSNLNRSRSKYNNSFQKFEKDSNNGSMIKDKSYGSLLGMSYASIRSKGSNQSKAQDCVCSGCNYKQKYEKYKASYQTMKKQLQIIKTQLQFTKDMNQHMQNQIKANFNNEDRERKMQRLRYELKQSQKDKQVLREKVLKYQKYVAKLKLQFKAKIQQIYRRVKKNT